jgi:hypothetical protein
MEPGAPYRAKPRFVTLYLLVTGRTVEDDIGLVVGDTQIAEIVDSKASVGVGLLDAPDTFKRIEGWGHSAENDVNPKLFKKSYIFNGGLRGSIGAEFDARRLGANGGGES